MAGIYDVLAGVGQGFNQAVGNTNTLGAIMDRQTEKAMRARELGMKETELGMAQEKAPLEREALAATTAAQRQATTASQQQMTQEKAKYEVWAADNTPAVKLSDVIGKLAGDDVELYKILHRDASSTLQPDKNGMYTKAQWREVKTKLDDNMGEYLHHKYMNVSSYLSNIKAKWAKFEDPKNLLELKNKAKDEMFDIQREQGFTFSPEQEAQFIEFKIKEAAKPLIDDINQTTEKQAKLAASIPKFQELQTKKAQQKVYEAEAVNKLREPDPTSDKLYAISAKTGPDGKPTKEAIEAKEALATRLAHLKAIAEAEGLGKAEGQYGRLDHVPVYGLYKDPTNPDPTAKPQLVIIGHDMIDKRSGEKKGTTVPPGVKRLGEVGEKQLSFDEHVANMVKIGTSEGGSDAMARQYIQSIPGASEDLIGKYMDKYEKAKKKIKKQALPTKSSESTPPILDVSPITRKIGRALPNRNSLTQEASDYINENLTY